MSSLIYECDCRLFAGEVMVNSTRRPQDQPDWVDGRPPRPPEACWIPWVAPHGREHPTQCWLRLSGQCYHTTVSVILLLVSSMMVSVITRLSVSSRNSSMTVIVIAWLSVSLNGCQCHRIAVCVIAWLLMTSHDCQCHHIAVSVITWWSVSSHDYVCHRMTVSVIRWLTVSTWL